MYVCVNIYNVKYSKKVLIIIRCGRNNFLLNHSYNYVYNLKIYKNDIF